MKRSLPEKLFAFPDPTSLTLMNEVDLYPAFFIKTLSKSPRQLSTVECFLAVFSEYLNKTRNPVPYFL
jgi:hypothetical protein